MCSLNWYRFDDHLGIAFTRDELVTRAKAELPKIYQQNGVSFIMPKDPQGGGSWLAVNEYGLAVLLLNDYQGQLKPKSSKLLSRGLLVKKIAACSQLQQVRDVIGQLDLRLSQPFQLAVIYKEHRLFWHYDGRVSQLQPQELPHQVYSSGHKDAVDIIAKRKAYIAQQAVHCEQDLVALHRSHEPDVNGQLRYAFCMHRDDACSQSLTYIRLEEKQVVLKYWDGQPCQSTSLTELNLTLRA